MADLGLVNLGSIRLQAQQRIDRVNSNFFTTAEWNGYINSSYKELYELLVTTYGDNYYVAPPFQFLTTANKQQYPLPDGVTVVDAATSLVAVSFYKLLGVDMQVNPSQTDGWVSLSRFEFTDRNKFWLSNTYNVLGYTNLKYKLMGNNIWFTPLPQAGQTIQLWYIPEAANAQTSLVIATTATSTTVTTTDTSGLVAGMSIVIGSDTLNTTLPVAVTVSSITNATTFVLSSAALATTLSQAAYAWSDGTTFECVAGWEEYLVVDAAIKAALKEETDPSALFAQKAALVERINASSPNRDAAIAPCTVDTLRLEGGGVFGPGTFGWGDGSW